MRWMLPLFCWGLLAQVADKANENYKSEQGRANIGRSLGSKDRNERQKPAELIRAMGLGPGMTVADVGTGIGYMLPFLSQAVGPAGAVYAEDIFPDFLEKARATVAEAGLKNTTFVLGSDTETKLPEGLFDVVLVLDVYHHFDYPEKMLASIAKALKPEGRLVVVEYHKKPEAMAGGRAMEHVRLGAEAATAEIEGHGFRLLTMRDHVPDVQWMGIFRKPMAH
ncbi:MAG TPA: methyltransferase domain-containing protein [Bryobacteraceae bacterium]|nr:methyltransferase domain-containing protein [Bryobacteraceae bacterium]